MKLLVPPPVQALLAGLAMWGMARIAPALSFAFPGQRPAAIALAAAGLTVDLIALAAFRRAKTTINPMRPGKTSALVAEGLYRYSRNPMYVGALLVLTGWAAWLGNPLNLAVLAVFVVAITELQIKPEEAMLRETFGAEYVAYAKRVRRWL
ncbi:MAG: isoprenylcysteine carboxylmethyltransferase family protein [Caulobacterales bacterium]|nr:isoprenylcysteine carboxylmethyltransferase family protein [Caulobacterales bacterium]